MRKIAIISIAVILLGLAGAAYFVNSKVPALVNDYTLNTLRHIGFEVPSLPAGDIRFSAARFENIILDKEGFSKIRLLEFHYNPFSLFIMNAASEASIEGLILTGEIAEDGSFGIEGWDQSRMESLPRVRTLSVEKSSAAILTRKIGGVSLAYDFLLRANGDGAEFRGNAKSSQPHLSFTASATGTINKHGTWQGDVEIEQGKFEISPVKASRINGVITLSGDENSAPKISSELQAGGLSLYDFPWQNASIALEKQGDIINIASDMKSVGVDGLELSLGFDKTPTEKNLSGRIHTDKLSALFAYLIAGEIVPMDTKAAAALHRINASIDFTIEPEQQPGTKSIVFNLKNNSEDIDLKGKIDLLENGDYSGTLSSDPVFLNVFEAFLTGAETDKSLFNTGKIAIAGNFEKKADKLSGTLKTELTDAVYDFGGLKLEGINGALAIDNLSKLSTKKTSSLSCALPITKGISHKCSLGVNVANGNVNVKSLDIGIFGGNVSALNYDPDAKEPSLTLEIMNIDLGALTKAMKIPGFTATGMANVSIPLTLENGKLIAKDGKIRSIGSGVITYKNEQLPKFFKGSDLELETLRLTLENYHYNIFEIEINGPLIDEADILVKSTGSNPDIMDDRPVAIHMNNKARLAPLFKNIIR